jgi:GLPGLI family protein
LVLLGFASSAFKTFQLPDNKPFEGIITYGIDVSEPSAASLIGSSLTVYIKGDKNKEIQNGIPAEMTFEDASKPNASVTLLTYMGSKYLLKNDPSDSVPVTPVITYEDGSKKIAGYMCNKAEISTKEGNQALKGTVYYCADLVNGPVKAGMFKGLKGMPLEYTFTVQGITITYKANKVKAQALGDDEFTPHTSGYKPMTQDEVMQDIQENMRNSH